MKCTKIESKLEGPGSGVERSEGLHLTPIIYDIAIKLGIMKPSSDSEDGKAEFFERGFIFEDLLSHVFATRMALRIGEITLDGITGSPDGLGEWESRLVVEEYKCTSKSLSRPIEDNWMWVTQVKAYCHMVGVPKAIMRVLYVAGDYKPPFPQYRAYLMEFSQRELEENWSMIVNHAKAQGWL